MKSKIVDEYSYKLGEKIADMLYMKMYHVDYNWYFLGKPSWIQISLDEKNVLDKLEKHFKNTDKKSDWNKILKYQTELKYKYLPHTISEYIDFDQEIIIKDFTEGIIDYLWNTDFCSYSLKKLDIDIKNNIATVKLKLPEIGENYWT